MSAKAIVKHYVRIGMDEDGTFQLGLLHQRLGEVCRSPYREQRTSGGKPEDIRTEVADLIVYESPGLGEVQIYTLIESYQNERNTFVSILMEPDTHGSVKEIVREFVDKMAFGADDKASPLRNVSLPIFAQYLSEWHKVSPHRFL